jgi:hypothetical protein
VLSAIVALEAAACTLNFDKYDAAQASMDASHPANDGRAPESGGGGACGQSCLAQASQCGSMCQSALQTCNNQCMGRNSNLCMMQCQNTQQSCALSCTGTCNTCVNNAGCSGMNDCADAAAGD